MVQKKIVIGWKVSKIDLSIASFRYRAIIPILALEGQGVENKLFSRSDKSCLAGLNALVIVKSFTWDDYWLAQEALNMGVPVILDLCDNIFVSQYGKGQIKPADFFLLIASIASAIVVTTTPLATIVKEKIGERIPVYVVPDGVENSSFIASAKNYCWQPQLKEYFYRVMHAASIAKLRNLIIRKYDLFKSMSLYSFSRSLIFDALKSGKCCKRFLDHSFWKKLVYPYYNHLRDKIRNWLLSNSNSNVEIVTLDKSKKLVEQVNCSKTSIAPPKKIVWFGNHGSAHSDFGIQDLLYIREPLEKLATEFNLELIVVSNNLKKFNKYILPMAISTRYIEWSAHSLDKCLHDADVVVIPNNLDDFSICKSANRSVFALVRDLPVVATSTPALSDLKECVVLDDFEGGLRLYLSDPEYVKQHVQKGQDIVDRLYGQHAIAQHWREIIDKTLNNQTIQVGVPKSAEVIIAINLPQDIDLIRPVLDEASHQGVHCVVWTSLAAVQRWPQLMNIIPNMGFNWRIFPDDLNGFDELVFSDSAYALLTITETNLNPHRFTHKLTKLANSADLFTATMQHGYENVGLSYDDEVHDIKRIRFASRRIYTWGNLETLHPNIHQQTLKKCFPVGCPKPDVVECSDINDWMPDGQPIIGIFENLHWDRYSDHYREFFLQGLSSIAKAFPNINFLIKPHNAGMWLTDRYQGELPAMDNLIIVDPKDPQWTSITAPQLLGHLAAVITTPSTVALDAARAKMPVAIVAQELDLINYEPLPLIRNIEDWDAFVSQAIDDYGCQVLKGKCQDFTDRVLLPGNAAWRIVKDIKSREQEWEIRKRG